MSTSGSLVATKRLITTNARAWSFRWWYWLLILLWEGVVMLATIRFVRVSGGWSATGALRTVAFFALLLLPVLVPLRVQDIIGRMVSAAVLMLLVVGGVWGIGPRIAVWLAPESEWVYQWRYAHSLDKDGADLAGAEVHVQPKPHDCEFLTAPIGSKHCYYTREMSTVRIRHRQAGRAVSYDEGRTWSDAQPTDGPSMYVSWKKVQQ